MGLSLLPMLEMFGMGKNDEIITVSHTAVATIAGIEQGGCTPVFADIDPNSRCIDPDSIVNRITKNTRAIMPVHIYGQPCEMKIIAKIADDHNLEIIEDCSQAHGAEIEGQKVGTFGSLAAFGCYPTKNLGGTGDGGIILAKSERLTKSFNPLDNMVGIRREKVRAVAIILDLMRCKLLFCV